MWIDVKEGLPKKKAGKFSVRREKGAEMDAYFYADKMAWIAFYGQKTSHWWDAHNDHERLDDVTHWKKNE